MPTFFSYYADFSVIARARRERLAARKRMKWEHIKAAFAAKRAHG